MNLMNQSKVKAVRRTGSGFREACVGSCQKILARVGKAKAAIFAESRKAFQSQERLLRLALNEAEAVAWETKYPHLFFPTLAAEKVQALSDWNAHQRSIRRTTLDPVFSVW